MKSITETNGYLLTEITISVHCPLCTLFVLCARNTSISTFFGRRQLLDLLTINPALEKMRLDVAGIQSSRFATRARLSICLGFFSTTPMVQSQLWFCPEDSFFISSVLLPSDAVETRSSSSPHNSIAISFSLLVFCFFDMRSPCCNAPHRPVHLCLWFG